MAASIFRRGDKVMLREDSRYNTTKSHLPTSSNPTNVVGRVEEADSCHVVVRWPNDIRNTYGNNDLRTINGKKYV